MRISVHGIPLRYTSTMDVISPNIRPGNDGSLLVHMDLEEPTGSLVLDIYLEREYQGAYLPVFSWVMIPVVLTEGVTIYGGSHLIRYPLVNTGLWRYRIEYTDETGTREICTYFSVEDALRIPSTTMVKSSVGGCDTQSNPRLVVIQGNALDVDAFLYDNQGDPFIGLSSAIGGEIRLINMQTRLVSGTIPFSDLIFDDPEFGEGSLRFTIPDSSTQGFDPGIYHVYFEAQWSDRVLEWPKLFDLNVIKQRV